MVSIYIVRHCEGIGNIQHIFNGTTDCEISELGALQLEKLGDRFKDIHIDAVYSSPLIRARKTAHSIADSKGLELIIEPGLIELYGGVVEGKKFSESFEKYPELKDAWINHPQDFHPIDGESMRHAYGRIYSIILKIAKESKGKTVVVSTHGGLIRCLLSRLLYGTIEKLGSVPWCENTDVALIEVDDSMNITLKFYGDHSHLTENLLPDRSKINSFVPKK